MCKECLLYQGVRRQTVWVINSCKGRTQHQPLTATCLLVNTRGGSYLKNDIHLCNLLRCRGLRSKHFHTESVEIMKNCMEQ